MVIGVPYPVIPEFVLGKPNEMLRTIPAIFGLLLIAVCAWYFLIELLDSKNTGETLTSRYISKEWGMLHRDEKALPLNNVLIVAVRQPLMGRFLDDGDIVVQTASIGATRLTFVPRPHK